MSRLSDPSAVEVIPLGACQCPGTPHEQDEATVRWQLGASALARIGRAEIEGAVRLDPMAAYRQIVLETVVSWNLLLPDEDNKGAAAPVTERVISELDAETLKLIAETADKLVLGKGKLPNASGAPSAASPLGSASPIRRRTRKPTT